MYSGYENWMTSGLDDLQRQALWLVYSAWRQGKPIDQQRAIFQLKREGADVHAAADALAGLINGQPDLALLHRRPGEDHLTPTIAAAIHLRDRAEAAADLEVLEALAVHLHATYDPECTSLPIADLATKLQISQPRLLQVIDLWKGPVQERLGVEPDALFWTSYDRFLRRVIGAPAASRTSAPRDRSAPLPIDVSVRQVRWMNIGPFARATTLGLGAMTFVVGANAAGKTTALAALAALRDVALHGLAGIHGLDGRLRADADDVLLAVDAALRRPLSVADDATAMTWQLVAGRAGRLHARSETARVGRDELASFERGTGRWRDSVGTMVEHTMSPDVLALHMATTPVHHWPLIALRQQVRRWWIELAPPARSSDALAAVHDLRWAPFRRDPEALQALRDVAQQVAGIRDLVVHRDVEIDDGRHRGPIDVMPRGVVRVVELLAVLFAPDPPPLVAIDEIENHLHGDLALRLLEVMRSVSHRTQVVVTTHSARVLRAAHLDEVQLCHRTPHGSAIAPLRVYPHLARLAASGDLGELIEGGHFVETP
ncbi:MAG: ATP-binding protein [Myxococcales bacterium]|nr:ATP-binding protein [Myxococcales bacterium]